MSARRPVLAASAVVLTGALLLTACAPAGPSSTGQRVDGGTIVYAHQQEPACVFGGWIEQAYLSYQVLDNLTSLDAHHRVVPWLAQSWTTSADGLTWTFTLKKGVKFTDGTPVDAAAVAYNFDYWLKGGNSTEEKKFTTEPPRQSLVEPPPGYQTPSPNYAYGAGPDKTRKTHFDIMSGKDKE